MSNEAFAEPGDAGAHRRGAPAAPRRAALPRRLRHVPPVRVLPRRGRRALDPRSPTAIATTCPRSPGSRRPSRRTRCRPSRATTTCSPRTTSTTASGCGSSTTSTAATTTRPSSSATPPGARLRRRSQEELCAAYFGEATPALLARMRLQMIMSDVGWTLWAAIQAAISLDRLRLLGLGRGALGRASTAFDAPDFEDLAGGGRRRLTARPAHLRAAPGRRGRPARPRRQLLSAKTSTSMPSPSAMLDGRYVVPIVRPTV